MTFNPNDARWTAYVLDELSDDERAAVEKELEASPEARAAVEEIRETAGLLQSELAKAGAARLLPGQNAAIRAAATAAAARRVRYWNVVKLAAAAMLLLGVALTITIPSLLRSRQAAQTAALNQIVDAGPGSQGLATGGPVGNPVPAPLGRAASPALVGPAAGRDSLPPPTQAGEAAADNEIGNRREIASVAVTENETRSQEAAQSRLGVVSAETDPLGNEELKDQATAAGGQIRDDRFRQTYAAEPPAPATNAAPSVASALGAATGRILKEATDVDRIDNGRRTRPGFNTEAYDRIVDNPFIEVRQNPLATFSIDVDTASYANVRRFLNQNMLPPKDSVRIEEMINYFSYNYASPTGVHPFAVRAEVASAPWRPEHRLVRIALKGRELDRERRPPTNLVFLIDVSGSMNEPNKLPLVKSGLRLLVDRLGENDRVAMVVYAGNSGLVLGPTRGDRKEVILRAIDRLEAGGSTNGASGIELAYNTAINSFVRGGSNRVILATDGDFNVGVTNQGDLTRLIEEKARSGVFLSVLGFGVSNYKDSTLEKLADRGNGNYAYIDTLNEARKVLVEQMGATLVTIAKDVKIQVEFNPAKVTAYRLIGYENRILQAQDFNDDTKDAGEIGAGHTVTALFEVVPAGVAFEQPDVDPLRYQTPRPARGAAGGAPTASSNELLNVKIRYKAPDSDTSTPFEVPLADRGAAFESASEDFRFAAAVAEFGMILRDSPHKGSGTFDSVRRIADRARGSDPSGYRSEFIELVARARALQDLR